MTEESNVSSRTRTWLVSGRVQGVGFRYATRQRIAELGLAGGAVNLADGRVRVTATGSAPRLEELERWLCQGPAYARVDSVTAQG
ncbi:MAG: acylphosphatase [Gammaproteobacteria bacterium]